MSFTALHRLVGIDPGPLTDELLDAAVSAGVAETHDLDWKSELPPAKGLSQTDFPKDVAAMANSGGGVIVYGVREEQRVATERVDVGDFDEAYERALRGAAITAISPPVFDLKVHRLGAGANRAVVVEIPNSVDGPHLIYKNDYFGAPVRNDSDTVWMKERQIEVMYRARFEERRHATETLDALSNDASAGRDSDKRAWLVAVARPRVPRVRECLSRNAARDVFAHAAHLAHTYAGASGVHPLQNVDRDNPRPGLRRWLAMNTATSEHAQWLESWASVHHDGSVTVATAVGGHRRQEGHMEGWEVRSTAIECSVADFMALVRATAAATDNDEYDVRVGIIWTAKQPLMILTVDTYGFEYRDATVPLHRFTPVQTTVNAADAEVDFHWRIHDLAQDCVNQGGISNVLLIRPPARDS